MTLVKMHVKPITSSLKWFASCSPLATVLPNELDVKADRVHGRFNAPSRVWVLGRFVQAAEISSHPSPLS